MAEFHIEAKTCLSINEERAPSAQQRQEVDTNEGHKDINIIEEKGNIPFVFGFVSLASS